MLADSPEALCAMKDTDRASPASVAAVEVKTINFLRTIEEAKATEAQFRPNAF